ncbi:Ketopantoate reductase PanG [Tenacibaculum discolor]
MIKVTIIGGGNVATHLANAFSKTNEVSLVQVYARNIEQVEHLKEVTSITNSIELLTKADLYIIAVSDDAIGDVSRKIKQKNGLVVHTSGSVAMQSLQNTGRKGIFYLLQSFSKDKKVDFNKIPFCLEAENEEDLQLLETLAKTIGKKIYRINSEQRKRLHVAAVFVNNFTNHMYKIGADICNEHQVPFEVLLPLIQETAQKITELSPDAAQTGPAKRNDQKTIQDHLALLNAEQQEIYKLITKSIQQNGKEL